MRFLIVSLFTLIALFTSAEVLAIEGGVLVSSSDEIAEKARKRMYDGGPDEEDLKVVEDLSAPLRTVNVRAIQSSVRDEILKSVSPEKEEGEEAPAE